MAEDLVALRCKYCGAPLDRKDLESDSSYVTCPSCGTSQQRMDAKEYLDQMMAQVQSWIGRTIPGGFSMSQSENVDSIARFNIFTNNVKPRIDAEYSEYRFATNRLLSSPLMVLPFTTDASVSPGHTSAQAFEFNARAKSIEPLAVDDASHSIVSSAEGISSAYALLINNVKLIGEDKPGRYTLMSNNFNEASAAFSGIKGYSLAGERLNALSSIATGCEKLLDGDSFGSLQYFERGRSALASVRDRALTDMDLGIMYQAVDMELTQAGILTDISSVTGDSLKVLDIVKRIFTISLSPVGKWAYLLENKGRFNEILDNLSKILSARNGGTLMISSGAGQYLMPFWDIDLKYSFQTGAAWARKSVEVAEDILVPADFVMDEECLRNPASALTDVFAMRPEKKILSGLKGEESSISGGEGIGKLSRTASLNTPGTRKVVVPLSTRKEAEKIVSDYLSQCMGKDSKLRLSKPYVKELIYIPCDIDGRIRVPDGFGALVPKRTARTDPSCLIIV